MSSITGYATVNPNTVTIPENRKRSINPEKVKALAESIKHIGQLQPIGVTADNTLLWGAHRVEAHKLLGRSTIQAVLYDTSNPLDAELAEIDENLARAELTELELATHLARRKAIYLERFPQTAHGGDRRSSTRQLDDLKPASFAQNTAVSTGVSERTVQRKAALGEKLAPVAAELKDTPIADNQAELQQFAALPPEQAKGVLALLKAGEVDSVKEALKAQKDNERERARATPIRASTPEGLETVIKAEQGNWYAVGPHRLYCGDTSQAEFWRDIPPCALSFADPPYNAEVAAWDQGFKWAHDYLGDIAPIVLVTPGTRSLARFLGSAGEAPTTYLNYRWLISCYINNGMTRGDLGHANHIPTLLFASDETPIYRNSQDVCVVSIKISETEDTDHRGRKPLDYMIWLIQLFTEKGQNVIDPFAGSGQTLWACAGLNRICYTGEINPSFCDDILRRASAQGLPVSLIGPELP